MNLTITLVFLVLTSTVRSLNILGIFPYHGTSHFLVFRVYLRELANRGHNVTVISHFPEKNPPANYQDISLAGTIEVLKDDMPVEKSYTSIINTALFLTFTGKENCEVMVKNKQVQDLVHSKAKFDVVVVEQFNSDCAFGIAYKLKAPVVGMMSHILMPWHYQRLGIPYNTAYVPFHFLEGGTKPSLYQRVERVLFDVYFRTLYYFVTQRSDQNTLARYFDEIPPLDQLAGEMKFLLTLKKFVDEAKHGVIYISFGSVISPSSLSHERVKAILEVVSELPQRFIWKWNNKTLLKAQDKLYTDSWLPQVDILGHPNTLAFFSHAGMGGTTEAIHFGVPIVAMPVLGDQPANGAAIEESGLGVQVQIRDLNKENLLAAFRKVLDVNLMPNDANELIEKNPPANYQDISLAGTIEVLKDDMPVEKSYTSIINTALFLVHWKRNCEVMTLKKFVDEAKHGVIYISFGSVISPSSLSHERVKAILEVVSELPQSWLPQVDILGHPNTLAFFSHAGMGGTTEAIHFGVPIVAMPVLGDQPANGAAIEESGLGVQVERQIGSWRTEGEVAVPGCKFRPKDGAIHGRDWPVVISHREEFNFAPKPFVDLNLNAQAALLNGCCVGWLVPKDWHPHDGYSMVYGFCGAQHAAVFLPQVCVRDNSCQASVLQSGCIAILVSEQWHSHYWYAGVYGFNCA
ncbi:hypothetical protein MSG28_004706 [Choristoneura fumiferana]|uniref:Uncharacterized protein n=1 Tax=Choristoneura fumiferana TaxID=7141 RepID=A0ACC0K807_CHOFU|nr:hypothetical protein MSG28_004706 [Choristoneura fumiferana]